MDITLYYAPYACSLVPYVTLTEAQATFDVHAVNIRQKHHMTPEYLALNPKHKVPFLVVDGKALSENVAIQLWISRSFPSARLLPDDIWAQAQAVSLLSWFASGVHPHISRHAAPQKFCDVPGTEERVRALAEKGLMENFRIANDLLQGRSFFFDHFTAPDAYLYWCMRRTIMCEIDLSEFVNLSAHFERMLSRESVQKNEAFERQVIAEFAAK